ncbi:MAG TPA: hypothetical protein VN222_09910 [Novosphingobium sp.]|nr:hypothetical protein [Novosphingobium sp.]
MLAISRTAERERLMGVMRRYLDALVAHDLRSLRFAPHLRNTENTVELPVGTGIARTIKALWADGHYFVDAATGQVEYWGVAEENTRQTMLAVRLRIEGTLIAEIETLSVRGKGEYFNTAVVASGTPGFHEVLPLEARVPRQRLIEIANLYFDGIERSDGAIVPARGDCLRLVNGAEDAGTDTSGMADDQTYRGLSVQEQIGKGYYAYIEALRGRRFIVADEERGIVLVHVLFDHPAASEGEDGVLPWPEPNTVLAFEAFKVRDGLIEAVWAIGTSLPYGIRSGWGDGPARMIAAVA